MNPVAYDFNARPIFPEDKCYIRFKSAPYVLKHGVGQMMYRPDMRVWSIALDGNLFKEEEIEVINKLYENTYKETK